VPRELPTDVGAGGDGKKKRRPDRGNDAYAYPTDTSVGGNSDPISVVQRHTTEQVPTMVKLALTETTKDQKQLIREARLATRAYDMTPQFTLGRTNFKDLVSPITGEELTMQEVRRLAGSRVGAANILSMIQGQSYLEKIEARVNRGRGLSTDQDPIRDDNVMKLLEVVGNQYREEDIPVAQGVAVALGLADLGVNHKRLAENLAAVERWTKTGVTASWDKKLSVASSAAQQGVKLTSVEDVIRYIQPEVVQASDENRAKLKALGATDAEIKAGLAYATARARALKAGNPLPEPPPGIDPNILGAIVGSRDLRAENEYVRSFTGDIEDYLANAEALKEGLVLREEAWENSPLNKWVATPILNSFAVLDAKFFQPIAITGKEVLENFGPQAGMIDLSVVARDAAWGNDPIDFDEQIGFDQEQYFDDIQAAWKGELRVSDTLVRDWNISRFQAEAIEFMAGWYIDPLVVAGKGARVATLRNVNPQILAPLRAGAVGEKKMARYFHKIDELVKREGDNFAKAMLSTDDTAIVKFSDRFLQNNKLGQSPFDMPYLMKVREEIKARGVSNVTRADLDEVLRTHFAPGFGTPGSLADIGVGKRMQEAADARREFSTNPNFENSQRVVQAHNGTIFEEAIDPRSLIPPRMEIPSLARPLPGGGMVQSFGNRFGDALGDTRVGANLRKLPTMNPGSVLKIHDQPDRWFKLQARRAGFTSSEVSEWQAKAALAAAGAAPEAELKKLITQFQTDAMRLRARPFGITDETADELLIALQGAGSKGRDAEGFFGTGTQSVRFTPDGTPYFSKDHSPRGVTKPILESELVNFLPAVDPIDMQRAISEYVGTARRMRAALQRAARKNPTALSNKALLRGDLAWFLNHGVKPSASFIMRTFKLQAVARPAYMFRVVLGDELLRSLATNQSLMEQALSYGWGLRKAGQAPSPGTMDKATAAIKGRLDTMGSRRIEGQVIGRNVDEIEPLANTQLDWAELAPESAKATERKLKKFQTSGEYGILDPGAANHLPAWEHALNNTIAQSKAGKRGLDAIAAGEVTSEEGLRNLLVNWSKTPEGSKFLSRIGKQGQGEYWAGDAATTIWSYTAGDKSLAKLARLREVGPEDLLARFPNAKTPDGDWARPYVHGPRLQRSLGGWTHEWVNKWYGLNVRGPENYLNRQPYYSQFKSRAEAAYARMGLDVNDPAVKAAARDFSLAHSKRIMFDFSENSRAGELLGFAFPFIQPWQENIAVWGHILTKRNPAMVGYVNRVAQLGINTGFIKKDPDTGEWVIPETWWAFTVPVLWAIGGREKGGGMSPLQALTGASDTERAYSLSTGLTSLNLFANSVFKVPEGVPGVGGLPLPAPGMYTPATYVLQKFTDDWAGKTGWRGSAHDYLFAFGPGSEDLADLARDTLLPRWLNKALAAVPGFNWDESLINDIGNDYLALQEYMGQDQDPDRARNQARMTAGWQGFMAAFFPGSARIEYPHSWLNTLYHDKIEEFDGDVTKARDWFNLNYPEYATITIPKTMTTRIYNNYMKNGEEYLDNEKWGLKGGNNPAPPGIRPASSQYYEAIIKQPGFKEFAEDPRTAPWAMLLMLNGQNPKADEFDMSAYASQMARDDVRNRAIEDVYEDAKSAEFWDMWTAVEEQYDKGYYKTPEGAGQGGREPVENSWQPGFAQIEKEGGYAGDNGPWDALSHKKALELQQVVQMGDYSEIDRSYVMPKAGGGYQFVFDSDGKWPEGLHPYVLESARLVLENDVVEDFPGVKGLREYWDLRTATRDELVKKGIDGLEDPDARNLKKSHLAAAQDIMEAYPEFAPFYKTWFQNDLRAGLPTAGEERVNTWFKKGEAGDEKAQQRYDNYQEFRTGYLGFRNDLAEAKADGREVAEVYQARTEYENQWYKSNPQIVKTWFDSLTDSQREQEKAYLYTRPPAFYSRMDWKLVGVELTNKASKWLEEIQREGVEIKAWELENDYTKSTGDRRTALSKRINYLLEQGDETFNTAIKNMGTWGYGAIAAGFTGEGKPKEERTRGEKAWRALLKYANGWRLLAEESKIHGDAQPFRTFDRDGAIWYENGRDNVQNYVQVLRKWSPEFDQEWRRLAENDDDPLKYWLFPEVHFKLGEVDAFN
jgi:hypothetical protein